MPEVDGLEATYRMKALNLDNLAPVVAMTAYSMEEDREKFLTQGMDDYLPKPIKAEKLIQTVKKWTKYETQKVTAEVLEEKSERLVINQNTLNQLRKFGGAELIESSLNEFDEEASGFIMVIPDRLEANEHDELLREMHTLKGNAGTLGVEKMADLAAEMEINLKENNFGKLNSLGKKLRAHLDEFKSSYKTILQDQ